MFDAMANGLDGIMEAIDGAVDKIKKLFGSSSKDSLDEFQKKKLLHEFHMFYGEYYFTVTWFTAYLPFSVLFVGKLTVYVLFSLMLWAHTLW